MFIMRCKHSNWSHCVQQEANAMFPVKTKLLKLIQVNCNNSIALGLIELISKNVLPLTCDQVWQCPHGALQLCSSSWVPPYVFRVPLIETAQSVYVLFNVRHYRFNLRHTAKYTIHLVAVSGIWSLHQRVLKFGIHRAGRTCSSKLSQNFRVDDPTLIIVPRAHVETLWFLFPLLAFSAGTLPDTLLLHQHPASQCGDNVSLRRAR